MEGANVGKPNGKPFLIHISAGSFTYPLSQFFRGKVWLDNGRSSHEKHLLPLSYHYSIFDVKLV
jgi:hypothetical protein